MAISCALGAALSGSGAVSKASKASASSAVSTTVASVGFASGGGLLALPVLLVESIHKREFVDLRDLLPENVFETFVSVGDKEKEKEKKKVPIESFQDWALACMAWVSTCVAATPSKGLELLQYSGGGIGRLPRDNPLSSLAAL